MSVEDDARKVAIENAAKHGGGARWETVLNMLLRTHPELRTPGSDAARIVRAAVDEVNALSPEALRELAKSLPAPAPQREERTGLPPLPGAEKGKVVLRFAPFPSGALHIGNARGVYINDEYRRMYDGKFYVVFDDTIGSEEKKPLKEGYSLILNDLKSAGVEPDAVYYKSDRIERHYRFVPDLLRSRKAYVCTCPAEKLRLNRENGVACPERENDTDWQVAQWEGMLSGQYHKGEAVVRLKTAVDHPNPAFRDRVLLRISEDEHPRVGHKYRVWPLLEYSWAIDDVELGITHVIRGKDLVMEDQMEEALWAALGMKGPHFAHWGMLRVRESKISKSKSMQEVLSGQYDGWTDPRTWSFGSLARRGIRSEAIRSFVLSFGMSLSDIEVPAESLYSENRKIIDSVAPRRAFVSDPIRVDVENFPPNLKNVLLPNHPEVLDLGQREIDVSKGRFYLPSKDVRAHLGEEIRLKELANVELSKVLGKDKTIVARFTSISNKPLPRFQWVPVEGAIRVAVLMPDGNVVEGWGESSLSATAKGTVYQFERFGFVCAYLEGTLGVNRYSFAHT
jgi:glutamyl-tRNA synthetase